MSPEQYQEKNKVIMAVAGSGKTTSLVANALAVDGRKILFLTYTNENINNIRDTFLRKKGYVPNNVEIVSWFTFLLRDGVRPYHNFLSQGERATSINFVNGSAWANPTLRGVAEANTEKFYFDQSRRIYTDKIAQYVCKCDTASGGKVIQRLEKLYEEIFIDEVQDLAGWDLEFLNLIFESKLKITLVGDPRQVTYSTNHARKYSQYRDQNIVNFFADLESKGKCEVINMVDSHRCNQNICDLADAIYPELAKSASLNTEITGHDGVFEIMKGDVKDYIETYNPAVLRHSISSNTLGYPARNFGLSKGLTFDRVLIFPTAPIKRFLRTKDPTDAGDRAKLYVAITRARHSVAFVVD